MFSALLSLSGRILGERQATASLPSNRNPRRPPEGWSLETIPLEIVLQVAKFLSRIERASLALVSRGMLIRLGTDVFKLDSRAQYAFLHLLHRDGMFLPDVLCPVCRVFHSPFPIHDLTSKSCYRSMRACQTQQSWERGDTPYLPVQVTFNTVAAVLSCSRHNMTRLFAPETLASSHKVEEDLFKIHTYYNFRVVCGHLIIKTEKLILPAKHADDILDAVRHASKVFEEHPWDVGKCCRHVTWASQYPIPLKSLPAENHEGVDDLLESKHREHHHCAWNHSLPCTLDCGLSNQNKNNFLVEACDLCFTDYSLGFVDLPDTRGRACVLTSWKDLGRGQIPADEEWQSHLWPDHSMTFRDSFHPSRSPVVPDIYRGYEKPQEWGGGRSQHRPSIDEKRFIRLGQEKKNKFRFEERGD
ncbi:hypothetical protein B0H66DRAFT_387481 [Apodospora peruviana]|uniref:F-box domain-containing protein n=1 Tax=Apodospora peruviana TaxID=516989 RepID=A0AAE0HUJ2_9PEZI|nr:hypothetical protein B0H66DRAFT_387481 [Apodospora peruviana]